MKGCIFPCRCLLCRLSLGFLFAQFPEHIIYAARCCARIYHSLPLHVPLFLVLAPVLSFVILFSASSRAASQQDVSSHLLLQAISCLWLSIHNSMVSCILPSPIYTWCHALFNAYCMVFCILHCPVLTYLSLAMFADPHADNAIHYVAPSGP